MRRLQQALPQIISEHQTGFMKGCNVKENIRKTIEISTRANREKIKAIILSIDFQKCFDLCKYKALLGSLKFFGMYHTFITWVELLFKNFLLCVQNNGFCSNYHSQTHGLHQGCCYSPLGYLLCGEIFSLIIHSSNLEGLHHKDLVNLLLQFADDSNLFLLFRNGMLDKVAYALDSIEDQLGLKVNYDKSTVYRIGSLENSKAEMYCQRPVAWDNLPMTMLGVTIHTNLEERLKLNFMPLVDRVKGVFDIWSNRNLTLMGQVLIVNR